MAAKLKEHFATDTPSCVVFHPLKKRSPPAAKRRCRSAPAVLLKMRVLLLTTPVYRQIYVSGSTDEVAVFASDDGAALQAIETNVDDGSINWLAVSRDGALLAIAYEDMSASLWDLKSSKVLRPICRATAAVTRVAFSCDSQSVAAGCADGRLTVHGVVNPAAPRVLNEDSKSGPVIALAFHPSNSSLLCAAFGDGTVRLCDIEKGAEVWRARYAPKRGATERTPYSIAWHPSGQVIAVPHKRSVIMLEADTGMEAFTLPEGEHRAAVEMVDFSPNGAYVASCGADKLLFVWDVSKKETVDRQKLSAAARDLRWAPALSGDGGALTGGNDICVVDAENNAAWWRGVLAPHFASPIEVDDDAAAGGLSVVPNAAAESTLQQLFADDDDDDDNNNNNKEDGAAGDGADVGAADGKRTKAEVHLSAADEIRAAEREAAAAAAAAASPAVDPDSAKKGTLVEGSRRLRKFGSDADADAAEAHGGDEQRISFRGFSEGDTRVLGQVAAVQEPFQPSASPLGKRRRFLVWNRVGHVLLHNEHSHSMLQIIFSDSRHRNVKFTDHCNFQLAALSEQGCALASRLDVSNNLASQVHFRPFNAWAPNSDWQIHLPADEDCLALALGATFVAVATDQQHLRIFSLLGTQLHVFALSGPVVCMAGFADRLAVVSYATPLGGTLQFELLDMTERRSLHGPAPLPLSSRNDSLRWLGFSELGVPATYDGTGVVRLLTPAFGGRWMPVLHTSRARKNPREWHWPIGLNERDLLCVVCKDGETSPVVHPLPPLALLPLQMPLAHPEASATTMEQELILDTLSLDHRLACDGVLSELEQQKEQLKLDTRVIKVFNAVCNQDKAAKAFELCKLLHFEQSLDVARRLADRHQMPALSERINELTLAFRENGDEMPGEAPALATLVAERQTRGGFADGAVPVVVHRSAQAAAGESDDDGDDDEAQQNLPDKHDVHSSDDEDDSDESAAEEAPAKGGKKAATAAAEANKENAAGGKKRGRAAAAAAKKQPAPKRKKKANPFAKKKASKTRDILQNLAKDF